jgi:hypothetical protein
MIVNKEQIVLSLQEKFNTKIEMLRQELSQSIFDAGVSEAVKTTHTLTVEGKELKTVAFKTESEVDQFLEKNEEWGVVGKDKGMIHVAKVNEDADPIEEAAPNMQDGKEPSLDINQAFKTFTSRDEVMSYFADTIGDATKIEFDEDSGVFSMKGKALAKMGKDGSYSVDVTAVANRGLVMSGKEAPKNTNRFTEAYLQSGKE